MGRLHAARKRAEARRRTGAAGRRPVRSGAGAGRSSASVRRHDRLRRHGARPAHLSLPSGHPPRPRADRRKPVGRRLSPPPSPIMSPAVWSSASARWPRTGATRRPRTSRAPRKRRSRRQGTAGLADRQGRARASSPPPAAGRGDRRRCDAGSAAQAPVVRRLGDALSLFLMLLGSITLALADRPWRLSGLDDALARPLGPMDRRRRRFENARGLDSLPAAHDNRFSSDRFGPPRKADGNHDQRLFLRSSGLDRRSRPLRAQDQALAEGCGKPRRVAHRDCRALVAGQGEASGVALAAEILRRYRALDPVRPCGVLPSARRRVRARSRAGA